MENENSSEENVFVRDKYDEIKTKRIRLPRLAVQPTQKSADKDEKNVLYKKVSLILQKPENDRTAEDNETLEGCSDVVREVNERWKKREAAKKRLEEIEDPEDVLNEKCQILAQAVAQSRHLVVYTGAGISTAAKIPDYRGPNGIWTRLKEGKDIGDHDLSAAEPTYTHMALYELYRQNILKYVVSQNCDGLHLRSGLPRTVLSEVHGNMYVEVCKSCKPHREYWRVFDVTENTARFAHKTFRRCYECNGPLADTIVHFGERGSLLWPLNWKGACKNAKEATTILCLGSSLKVLKKYPWLWQMDKPVKKRPNLYIVNLQWTPKDDCANVKIHGKCDVVIKRIMDVLGIQVPRYDKRRDPMFWHATALNDLEAHTTSRPGLAFPQEPVKDCPYSPMSDLNLNCDKSRDSLPQASHTIDSILHAAPFPFPLFDYRFLLRPYSDLLLYPYQTSFLYPGLHSIINTLPVGKEEAGPKAEPACDFCHRYYRSHDCLFYKKAEPVFVKQESRYSSLEKRDKPNVCLCCDYSTEEEEEPVEGGADQKVRIQAGWFGKGYKKGRRQKRKAP
ncbi:NAD-dependent protein deacetylase sirtuin-7 [Cylas formicarius]|uniref:NAD-dependent protein deacetylase sirtuin-7 n=1 Tax=Cylas formicarius TaxID=197179 RepID=UPI0029585213|nr:NAD-dependent protein deacetylase sirtuin-7 [Cylas formicarius]